MYKLGIVHCCQTEKAKCHAQRKNRIKIEMRTYIDMDQQRRRNVLIRDCLLLPDWERKKNKMHKRKDRTWVNNAEEMYEFETALALQKCTSSTATQNCVVPLPFYPSPSTYIQYIQLDNPIQSNPIHRSTDRKTKHKLHSTYGYPFANTQRRQTCPTVALWFCAMALMSGSLNRVPCASPPRGLYAWGTIPFCTL